MIKDERGTRQKRSQITTTKKGKKSNISINEMTGNEQKMKGGMAFAAAPPTKQK
jgi:hypothetical protein